MVTWRDIQTFHLGWMSEDLAKSVKAPLVHTPGWVIEDTAEDMTITTTYSINEDGKTEFMFSLCIPKGCIVKITPLGKKWLAEK